MTARGSLGETLSEARVLERRIRAAWGLVVVRVEGLRREKPEGGAVAVEELMETGRRYEYAVVEMARVVRDLTLVLADGRRA